MTMWGTMGDIWGNNRGRMEVEMQGEPCEDNKGHDVGISGKKK